MYFFRITWEVFYDFTFTFLRQKNDFGYMAARHIGPIDRMRLNYWGTFNSNWFERTLWVAIKETSIFIGSDHYLNPLRANSPKWSNTLKQFVSKLSTDFLSVFDHFVGLLPNRLNKPHIQTYLLVCRTLIMLYRIHELNHSLLIFPTM